MRNYVMIQRPSLPADMLAAISRLDALSDEAIINEYNAQCRLGFTGVYAQAIYVLALHQQLKRRFGSGPLSITDNALLTLGGCVAWDGTGWVEVLCGDCRCGLNNAN